MGVRIDEVWKQQPGAQEIDIAYFVVRRPTNLSAKTYEKSLGLGTMIALFGYTSKLKFASGAPNGLVYEPSPQGRVIERAGATADNVWGSEVNNQYPGWKGAGDIAGLRAALRLG
ncbi:hypothetical protein FHP29_17370 [Nocardioides albidus]|uniref:Uncharacterized protein n=1 Tax=Nocardioides albidus TaxID=1517589 RepID=A0A5C4VP57_9ACTN|nr:hypothetical protein [Nocardioides albidus]TNM37571.1 hypothetical protein FHP29_17370 [Nocardioides albidus]